MLCGLGALPVRMMDARLVVMSLRLKSEAVKEASFEVRHGTKIIYGERGNYNITNQTEKQDLGKRAGSADIKDDIKREMEGEILRAAVWFWCKEGMGDLPVLSFRLYFRLVVLSSMLEATDFSNKSAFLL